MRIAELKPVYTGDQIVARTRELGEEMSRIYADGGPLVMICVLKGAFMFFADLVRHITVPLEVDFVRIASYGAHTSPQGISFIKDVETPLAGKNVVVVDDIVDTGHTVHFLLRELQSRGARSLRVAALVDKRERRVAPVTVDFSGFALSGGFIVGYGLDYAEAYRELPGIFEAVLAEQPPESMLKDPR